MMSLDGTILILVQSFILFIFLSINLYIYTKFRDKKPILSLFVCIGIIIFTLYLIYFISGYGADVGWWVLPPPSNLTTNLTLTLNT